MEALPLSCGVSAQLRRPAAQLGRRSILSLSQIINSETWSLPGLSYHKIIIQTKDVYRKTGSRRQAQ